METNKLRAGYACMGIGTTLSIDTEPANGRPFALSDIHDSTNNSDWLSICMPKPISRKKHPEKLCMHLKIKFVLMGK